MTDDEQKELGYHLQELHADLTGIRRDLETAALPNTERTIQGAWNGAWAMLEHDLEVHLPRALALLGKTLSPFQVPQGRRTGDAAVPASAAREARRLVEHALAVLPPPDDVNPLLVASKLIDVAGMVDAAYQLAAEMLKVVSPESLEDGQDDSPE